MDSILGVIERILYTEIIGELNLYTILSNIFKFIFVFIVFYFIYLIVRMIYLDMRQGELQGQGSDAYLKLISPPEHFDFPLQQTYVLGKKNTIGREIDNTLVIRYPYLSKNHASITFDKGDYYIEDLGSVNGTIVNGEPISKRTKLVPRDIIGLVELEFSFMRGEENESNPKSR